MRIWPRKRFLIGLAVIVGMLLVVNAFLAWRAEWRLGSRIAAIRAEGDPASIAELAPEAIADEENAAAILHRIAPRVEEFANEHGRFFNTPIGKAYDERLDRGESPTPEQIDAIRAIVDKYPDLDAALAAAAACDSYASQLDFSLNHTQFLESLIDNQSLIRQAARYLGWKSEVLAADGNAEEAAICGLEALRLARLYDSEPTLVSLLIAIAVRTIACNTIYDAMAVGPISPELRAELDAELARQDDPQRLIHALKTERAISADWFPAQAEGHPFVAHVFGWQIKNYQVGALDALDELFQMAGRPWQEVRGNFGNPDSPPPSTGHGVLADLLLPALGASFQANARSTAMLRCLRIANRLEQFTIEHGREASGLEELDLPTEATFDPYSGEPLMIKHTDDGWIVYTVMDNRVDDGGDFKGHKDFGVAPRKWRLTE